MISLGTALEENVIDFFGLQSATGSSRHDVINTDQFYNDDGGTNAEWNKITCGFAKKLGNVATNVRVYLNGELLEESGHLNTIRVTPINVSHAIRISGSNHLLYPAEESYIRSIGAPISNNSIYSALPISSFSTLGISHPIILQDGFELYNEEVTKFKTLKDQFDIEVGEYPNYLRQDIDLTISKFNSVAEVVVNVNYSSVEVELTPDNSVIFNLILKKGSSRAYIEYYFSPENGEEKSTFYSLYENHECLSNGFGTTTEVIETLIGSL